MKKTIFERLTPEELAVMKFKVDDTNPDRIATDEECNILCRQVQIQQKYRMSEADYWKIKGGMGR